MALPAIESDERSGHKLSRRPSRARSAAFCKTVPQIALNWLLQRPTVSSVIVGARNEEQLRQNLGVVGWKLTPQQVAKLDQASAVTAPYPHFPLSLARGLRLAQSADGGLRKWFDDLALRERLTSGMSSTSPPRTSPEGSAARTDILELTYHFNITDGDWNIGRNALRKVTVEASNFVLQTWILIWSRRISITLPAESIIVGFF